MFQAVFGLKRFLLVPRSFLVKIWKIKGRPLVLIEAKLSDTDPSPALRKFQGVLKKPAIQLVDKSKGYRTIPNGDHCILVAPAYQWLAILP